MDRAFLDLRAELLAVAMMAAHALEKLATLSADPDKFLADMYGLVEQDAERFVLSGNASDEDKAYVRAQIAAHMQRIVATASTGMAARRAAKLPPFDR